jgi:DNA polymerase-3 subunit epsilon
VEWSNKIFNGRDVETPKFAIVDIETTGLKFDRDQILQIAVVVQDWTDTATTTVMPTSVWSTYVRPPQWWNRDLGPQHVHGISRRKLIFAPSTEKAMRSFAQQTKGHIVVAHNADFDTKFLRAAAHLHNIDLEWAGVVCTLNLSRKLDPQRQQTHKLSTLCEKYGVTLNHAHHAEYDARATAELLPHLLNAHKIQNLEELQPFVRS